MEHPSIHHPRQCIPFSHYPQLTKAEMYEIFRLCRANKWLDILKCVTERPEISLFPIIMGNNLVTTIIHQAITSRGNIEHRTKVILTILHATPQAATIKNGYGSLPLHVIGQRNTKIDSRTKEILITKLVTAYEGAITEQGGVGKRTPLHILFTGITRMMIEKGPMACFMRDKKGYLPIHVACTRHCSPEKLDMLLAVNPVSLVDRTAEGFTILELAMANKTASHPNQALIEDIERRMKEANIDMSHFEVAIPATPMDYTSYEYRGLTQSQYLLRNRLDSNDSARVSDSSEETHAGIQMDYIDHATQTNLDATDTLAMMTVSNRDRHYQDRERKHQSKISMGPIRKRKVCVSDNSGSHNARDTTVFTASTPATVKQEETSCKPTIGTTENSPAHLLLHFSQNVSSPTSGSSHEYGPSHKPQELLEDMTTG